MMIQRLMLVVDAKITDEEGPFRVRLTNSVKVNVMFYLDPVPDADVRIYDDKGNSFQLKVIKMAGMKQQIRN